MSEKKFIIDLRGADGNVYSVIARVSERLMSMGELKLAKQFRNEAFKQKNYEAVLELTQKYVQVEFKR